MGFVAQRDRYEADGPSRARAGACSSPTATPGSGRSSRSTRPRSGRRSAGCGSGATPPSATRSLDALLLSEAMTRKASIAGLHQGGGKAVVLWDEHDRPRPRELLRRAGPRHRRARRALPRGGGRRRDDAPTWTAWPRSRRGSPASESRVGGSGDPSPVTAFGVCTRCTRCARSSTANRPAWPPRGRAGCRPRRLPPRTAARGRRRRVVVCDLVDARADTLARELGIGTVAADDALSTPCDILSPSALGGVVDDGDDPGLRCRAVVGAANNQLGATASIVLAARGSVRARLRRERRRHHQHRRGVHRLRPRTRARAGRRDRATTDPGARRDRAGDHAAAGRRADRRRRVATKGPASLAARRSRRLDQRRHPPPPLRS